MYTKTSVRKIERMRVHVRPCDLGDIILPHTHQINQYNGFSIDNSFESNGKKCIYLSKHSRLQLLSDYLLSLPPAWILCSCFPRQAEW